MFLHNPVCVGTFSVKYCHAPPDEAGGNKCTLVYHFVQFPYQVSNGLNILCYYRS